MKKLEKLKLNDFRKILNENEMKKVVGGAGLNYGYVGDDPNCTADYGMGQCQGFCSPIEIYEGGTVYIYQRECIPLTYADGRLVGCTCAVV
ncbi:TIGR04149 family rSAM-modified RiPP [Lascolabacillus massiliensis]|uniref:TIGR04149 family rSAM-modified RiPP n=1 Tax=Lascolabacillus massiliensis TaxID=1627894 RepID=UPI0006B2F296|nr:TIGR04149 family rSAM-modified RiPP [Lascolabacillus massiliensis]